MFGFGWLSKIFNKKTVVRKSPPEDVPVITRSTRSYANDVRSQANVMRSCRSSSASSSRSNVPKSSHLRDRDLLDDRGNSDHSDFVTSMAVAQMTNSTMMGYVAGGSVSGAVVGDLITDGCINACQQPDPTPTHTRACDTESHCLGGSDSCSCSGEGDD